MFNGMMDPELIKLAQEQMSRMSPDELAKIQQQMMSNPDLMKMASESMKNMRPDDLKQAAEQLKYTRPDEMAEIGEKMANASPEEIAAMRSRIDSQVTYEMNAAEMLKKQVLNYEGKNLKALYRRGQAYKELGQLQDAVSDLAKAHEMSPEDDTIAAVLRDAEERLAEEGSCHVPKGVVIEEITEDVSSGDVSSGNHGSPSQESMNVSNTNVGGSMTSSESLHALKDDPEAVRTFQNFISNTDAETLAALNGGKAGDISPDMFKTATNMIGRMSPDELQKMLQMASSFQRGNPFSNGVDSIGPGSVPPNMSPDMIKAASEMMGNMPPEELQKMFKMASSLRGENAAATGGFSDKNVSGSGQTSKSAEPREHISVHGSISGDPSSSSSLFSRSMSADQSGFPSPGGDLQEQLRNQMNDPATRQMFASMMKNMSPETVANMSKQFGVQLSPEDAAKAQQAMSSLSPEDLDKMMRWMDRLQKGAAGAKKAKNWLLGKPGLIMAICMLLLAMLLHWLGFIGR
ncbi:Outer envelope protein 61 [Linum perenne]